MNDIIQMVREICLGLDEQDIEVSLDRIDVEYESDQRVWWCICKVEGGFSFTSRIGGQYFLCYDLVTLDEIRFILKGLA